MKKLFVTTLAVALAITASVSFARNERGDWDYSGRHSVDDLRLGNTKITATGAEINTACDKSATVQAVSVTNNQTITLSASYSKIALTGIGSADDGTNTITINPLSPADIDVMIYMTVGTSNLVKIADSTKVMALGSDWIGDETDTLSLSTIAVSNVVKTASADN